MFALIVRRELIKVNIVNLVWNDYIKFLKDKNVNTEKYNLREGYYWLDNSIIKAYDTEGKIHKIVRICINDDLNVIAKEYKKEKKEFVIESWQDTINRNKERLEILAQNSLRLIKDSTDKYKEYSPIVLSSTGKDSMLVWHLVKALYNSVEMIFNNTTLDCADTYKFVKTFPNVRIVTHKEGFYQWRDRLNFVPTRFSRACCTLFKEQELINQLDKNKEYLFFMGMRNEESNARSGYTDEWKNEKWGNREWQGILPIREWSEEDVWLYTLWKDIPINPKYKKGYSRIGCAIACPYYTKSTWVLDKYWYPKMYDRWQNILDKDFTKNNKALIMNCTKEEYKLKAWNGGVFRVKPTEEVINEFAISNELNTDIAKKYFNHTCRTCDKKIKSKEVMAMNMKYFGRDIIEFYCKKHLKEELVYLFDREFTNDNWNECVERFKDQGCNLF